MKSIQAVQMLLVALLIIDLFMANEAADRPCVLKEYRGPNRFVCVCNATYCDEIEEITQLQPLEAVIIESSESGKRFQKRVVEFEDLSKNNSNQHPIRKVIVNERLKFQEIIGFGGAFTDAAAINLNSLSKETQQSLINSYFSKNGLQYSLGRIPIASCDFSTHIYSYDDVENDFDLKHFSLAEEDYSLKIPFIKKALELTDNELYIFASPWSAPAWMKSTGKMEGGGTLKANESYYRTWAQYFVKFIEHYKKAGVNIWALTVQNEPTTGVDLDFSWQTMYFDAITERNFIKNYLGPRIKQSTITRDVRIMILDDQKAQLPQWADQSFRDEHIDKYVSGLGVHWYVSFDGARKLSETHNRQPTKFILATEACTGFLDQRGPNMGDWNRAIEYVLDIVEDLSNWVVGWTDWNLCLDFKGGPNWANNFVDSSIIVNATADEFYKQPMFYAMGHFSKFVRPGSYRIEIIVNDELANYEVIAFLTPKSEKVLILNNRYFRKSFELIVEDMSLRGRYLKVTLEPRSIMTIVWKD